jgi:hypothetical protein
MTSVLGALRPIRRTVLALALALSPLAWAQAQQSQGQNAPEPGSQGTPGSIAEARTQMQEAQQELEQIRDQALSKRPELREQQADLQQRITERVRAEGVDPEADMQRLQEIASEIRGGDLSEERQQELIEEYESTRTALLEARRAALQDQAIQEDTEAFRSALLDAMREEDDSVDELIQDLTEAQQTLRREMHRGTMGGGQGQPTE